MRQYRGKRIDNGEWVYGWFLKHNEQTFIIPIFDEPYQWDQDSYEVDPKTVGQYTGLKEISEGDVVEDNIGIGQVVYSTAKAAFMIIYKDGLRKWFVDFTDEELKAIEIIGNVFDNPELLGEE